MSRRGKASKRGIFRTGIRRRITIQDANAVAERVSKTLCTEREACLVLDIKPDTWVQWKMRHGNSSAFESIITRIREGAIDKLLSDIEGISDGDQLIKLKPDWRGKEFLLKVRARERFNFSNVVAATDFPVNASITDAMRRAFAGPMIDIDTTNVTTDENKNQTPLIALSAPLRTIPPRKHKAE